MKKVASKSSSNTASPPAVAPVDLSNPKALGEDLNEITRVFFDAYQVLRHVEEGDDNAFAICQLAADAIEPHAWRLDAIQSQLRRMAGAAEGAS